MPNLSGFVIDSGLGDCPGLCGLWHPGLVGVPFSQDDRTRYGKQFFRASGTVVGAALFWRLAASTSCSFRYLPHRTAALLGFATKSGWCAPQAEAFTLEVPPEVGLVNK